MLREYREFNVGDRVVVVSEPYYDCPFTWVTEMSEMCGKPVTISYKEYSERHDTYFYKLLESRWHWCGNCFVGAGTEEELPEIEDESFLSIICGGG